MTNESLVLPQSLDALTELYENHKNGFILDFHKKYFKESQIKAPLPLIFGIIGIVIYSIYWLGLFLIASEFSTWEFPGFFLIFFISILCLVYILVIIPVISKLIKINKWNWLTWSTFWTFFFAILLSWALFIILQDIMPRWSSLGVQPSIYHYIIMILGYWGIIFIFFFEGYLSQISITDFGGIHLYLGWIYKIGKGYSKTQDLRLLTKSFKRLILELENWIKKVYQLVFQSKDEIESHFYSNLINNPNFLNQFLKNIDTNNLFNDILIKDLISKVKFTKTNKELKEQNFYTISFHTIPKIIQLVKLISTNNTIQFKSFSGVQKIFGFISKLKTPFISLIAFLISYGVRFLLA